MSYGLWVMNENTKFAFKTLLNNIEMEMYENNDYRQYAPARYRDAKGWFMAALIVLAIAGLLMLCSCNNTQPQPETKAHKIQRANKECLMGYENTATTIRHDILIDTKGDTCLSFVQTQYRDYLVMITFDGKEYAHWAAGIKQCSSPPSANEIWVMKKLNNW